MIGGNVSFINKDPALVKPIAKAHLLKTELEAGAVTSIKAFAAQHNLDHGDAKNLMPIAYLAPTIIDDIVSGRHPIDLTAKRLKHMSVLPILWVANTVARSAPLPRLQLASSENLSSLLNAPEKLMAHFSQKWLNTPSLCSKKSVSHTANPLKLGRYSNKHKTCGSPDEPMVVVVV